MEQKKAFIYKNGPAQPFAFAYLVVADKEWPHGRVIKVAETRWGARRIARKYVNQNPTTPPGLVEVVK